jgi:N-acetylglucosamine-6-phosphate deacetylase
VSALTAAAVITPAGVLSPGTVTIDDGHITDVREGGTDPLDVTLAPGFVDLQVNDWADLRPSLLAQGVTAWCPTLVTSQWDSYAVELERIAAPPPDGSPAVLGAHLEGPFLGGAPGAHPVSMLRPFDREWLDKLPAIVRLMTVAPELDGAPDVISALVERGVVVSLGHSTASYEETLAAIDAGATMVTHLFNGMGPLHHREPGLLGAALTDRRLYAGLIADLVHVHPAGLALAFAAKGADRIVLVTDAVSWPEPVDDAPRLGDGTLAGSCLTMDRAIANVVQHAGVPLPDAIRAASTNPADLMGAADRGRIEVGARADLVGLDADLRVATTWIAGDPVFSR